VKCFCSNIDVFQSWVKRPSDVTLRIAIHVSCFALFRRLWGMVRYFVIAVPKKPLMKFVGERILKIGQRLAKLVPRVGYCQGRFHESTCLDAGMRWATWRQRAGVRLVLECCTRPNWTARSTCGICRSNRNSRCSPFRHVTHIASSFVPPWNPPPSAPGRDKRKDCHSPFYAVFCTTQSTSISYNRPNC